MVDAAKSLEVYRAYLRRQELVRGGGVAANWTAEGLWLAEVKSGDTVIVEVDQHTGESSPLFDAALTHGTNTKAGGFSQSCLFDYFGCREQGAVVFGNGENRWQYDPAAKAVTRLDCAADGEHAVPKTWLRAGLGGYLLDEEEVPEALSPDGAWFAGVRSNNIRLRSAHDGSELQLTHSGTPEQPWDMEAVRYRSLPGLRRLTTQSVSPWSPDSWTLIAYRRDSRDVFRIPRINWLKPAEEVDFAPYQKAGAPLGLVEPLFIDLRGGTQVQVIIEENEDRYIQWLGWHPDGAEALFIVYTRELKRVEIMSANRETGAARRVLLESAPTPVKSQLDEVFSGAHGFHLLPSGSGFLWLSSRDGWNHIYRYDMNGRLLGQLTHGAWPVHALARIGADGYVYFTAAPDTVRPYDVHVCRVRLDGGPVDRLTRDNGIHDPWFSPTGQAFLDTHSSVDRPTRTDLCRADGAVLRVVSEMDTSRLADVGYTAAQEFTVKAADGVTDLWGVLYKPFNFDPTLAYPVVEFIYGGPQVPMAQRFFAVNERKYLNLVWALAHLGYVTVCLDARGTPGRSKAFQDAVNGNWSAGIPDHADAIRQLCAQYKWMDSTRVGIYGHSWGGYFSTCALMNWPDVYHAAVSSEPGYDPWHYILSEPYLGMPQINRLVYEQADLIRQASKVRRPLMVIAGTRYNLVTSPVMKMTRALIEAGVDHDLVLVPGATHHFVGVEEDYVIGKLTAFLDRHVKNRCFNREHQ